MIECIVAGAAVNKKYDYSIGGYMWLLSVCQNCRESLIIAETRWVAGFVKVWLNLTKISLNCKYTRGMAWNHEESSKRIPHLSGLVGACGIVDIRRESQMLTDVYAPWDYCCYFNVVLNSWITSNWTFVSWNASNCIELDPFNHVSKKHSVRIFNIISTGANSFITTLKWAE